METQGKVKLLRKDKKGLQLENGDWYSSFNNDVDCNVGDEVKITFSQNQSNGRTFNNFNKIEVISKSTTTEKDYSEGNKYKQTSVMISYVKDLVIADKIKLDEFESYAHKLMTLQENMINPTIPKEPKIEIAEKIKPEDFK